MIANRPTRVALLAYGDRDALTNATFEGNRLQGVANALKDVGIAPVPVVYNDDFVDETEQLLTDVDAVLVWVNPIEHGHDRSRLDTMLRSIAGRGVLVSAHPDVILKMGTKEVLVRTREMSWGTDTRLYPTIEELRRELPARLDEGSARVLKQYRGNGGNGVWKLERHPTDPSLIRVHHALRGSVEEVIELDEFFDRCRPYFSNGGRIIDQPYQERLIDGMVRCYLVQDNVAGFGHQAINALYPAPPGAAPSDAPQPGPRLYYPPSQPEFQAIKTKMQVEWITELCRTLDIEHGSLPLIWDADLLYGPKSPSGEDTYVLCEINVSSVYPFPDAALEPLAAATQQAIARKR